jgi:hypothetical protein
MLALALILDTTAAAHVLAVVGLACILVFLVSRATSSPQQRMMRARRRHAHRTAHVMRRMSEIRRETARRMDRAEERRRS